MILQVHVEGVVDGNENDDTDELSWVDGGEAVFHPERAYEESSSDDVATDAEHFVDHVQLVSAVVRPFLLLARNARVDDDAEGEEEGVLSEEKDDEDAADVTMSELVDEQVEDADGLEEEEGLDLGPACLQLVVVADSDNHVNRHHGRLNADPALLQAVAERVVVRVVVERLIRDVIGIRIEHYFLSDSALFSLIMMNSQNILPS